MLNFFRKQASMIKIVFGVVLFMTCISMVVTLIPGITGDSDQGQGPAETVASVGGEKITSYDVQQGLAQLGRSNQLPPEMMSLYTQQILDQLIVDKATVMEAERLGLRVSDQDMLTRLRMIPQLFPNGKFIGRDQYEALVEEQFQISVADFEKRFRDEILTEKLRDVVTDSLSVSPDEVRKAFAKDNEKLVLSYVFVTPADMKKGINPTDAELQEYYQKNKDRYQLPEQRSIKVLLIETAKVKAATTIPEADIQKYYHDHQDSYRTQERVSVHHILFRATDKEPEKLAAARKKADDLLKQIKAGANFDDLAKKNSEDTASAVKGGDLGWVVRGQTVPNFEKAAFSLAPGTVSEPVQTEYGIHIIKVIAHEQARLKPLEEVHDEIRDTLLNQTVPSAIADSADKAAADWRKDPSKADAIAAQYHATVLSPPPFGRGSAVSGILGSESLADSVFVLEKGQIGRAVGVAAGYAIPMLEDIAKPRTQEYSEVKDKVRSDYIDDQAKDKAQAKALELAQTVEKQDKRDLEKQAKAMGLEVKKTDPLTRAQPLPSIGTVKDLGPSLDTMKPGDTAGPVPIAGGQVVYQLESLTPPDEATFKTQSDVIRQRLLSEKQGAAFALFQTNLKSHMVDSGDVKVYQAAVDKLNLAASR